MIFIILLLCLTSCVCGTFVVNVTQTSSQAEENQNITLEVKFTSKPGSSLDSLSIYCELLTELRPIVLYYLYEGVEVSESQDEQFAGRVQCDEDDFREGRFRLHVSTLRTEDSGTYKCYVNTSYGMGSGICSLNVTAKDQPEPETPNTTSQPRPEPETSNTSWGRIALYCGLTAAAVVLLGVCLYLLWHFLHRQTK